MIRNGPKWIISTNGEVGLLQMVLESITEQCASEDVGSYEGGLLDLTSIGEWN